MMKVAVRADGNSNIGLGHIQRCLALSSQLQKRGVEVLFITKINRIIKEKIEQKEIEVIELREDLNLEEDLRCTTEIIKINKIYV